MKTLILPNLMEMMKTLILPNLMVMVEEGEIEKEENEIAVKNAKMEGDVDLFQHHDPTEMTLLMMKRTVSPLINGYGTEDAVPLLTTVMFSKVKFTRLNQPQSRWQHFGNR